MLQANQRTNTKRERQKPGRAQFDYRATAKALKAKAGEYTEDTDEGERLAWELVKAMGAGDKYFLLGWVFLEMGKLKGPSNRGRVVGFMRVLSGIVRVSDASPSEETRKRLGIAS